jgi:hypothetical protein
MKGPELRAEFGNSVQMRWRCFTSRPSVACLHHSRAPLGRLRRSGGNAGRTEFRIRCAGQGTVWRTVRCSESPDHDADPRLPLPVVVIPPPNPKRRMGKPPPRGSLLLPRFGFFLRDSGEEAWLGGVSGRFSDFNRNGMPALSLAMIARHPCLRHLSTAAS